MTRIDIELHLESEVIQTAAAATLGVHHSLDYIRGSTFLGVAAGRLYRKLGRDAYDVFHSGRVRFLDAVPLGPDGTPALPAPMGWLHRKDEEFIHGEEVIPERVFSVNNLSPGQAADEALKQVRKGYFTRTGHWVCPASSYRLKTAIERTTRGCPKGESLFGYEALSAGRVWRSAVEIDDEVDEQLVEQLRGVFDDQLIWLGRSRGAEYGRVHCTLTEPIQDPDRASNAVLVAVYLTSDTALLDPVSGEPTLTARPDHFGLPADWKLVPERSAVITRRYSPFNGKRRRRDLEHVVLCRRSVLTFQGSSNADLDSARLSVAGGVGQFRVEGLGQVRIAPWFLDSLHPAFNGSGAGTVSASRAKTLPIAPPCGLSVWLDRRREGRKDHEEVIPTARAAAQELAARSFRLLRSNQCVPTRSQWNRVSGIIRAELQRQSPHRPHLEEQLSLQVFARGVSANLWSELSGPFMAMGSGREEWHDARQIRCLFLTARLTGKELSEHRKGGEA